MLKEEGISATDYLTDLTDVTDVRNQALVIYQRQKLRSTAREKPYLERLNPRERLLPHSF